MATISQVALSNTFNEFRTTFNTVANTVTEVTSIPAVAGVYPSPVVSAGDLLANTLNTSVSVTTINAYMSTANVSSLTSGRVVLAGTTGRLVDDDGLTYNTSTNTLTSGNLAVGGTSTFSGIASFNGETFIYPANGTIDGTLGSTAANLYFGHVHANTRVHSGSGVAGWLTETGSDEAKHTFIGAETSNDAIDIAIVNQSTGTLAYSEFIAMNDRGNTDSGWISMGINSSNYNDPAFQLTKKDDAYILYEAPAGSAGTGDMVIATGSAGSSRKIIFGAGGFATGNTQMEIEPDTRVYINIPTNSSSTTTGALVVNGGVGLSGNLNVGGNVTITGAISLQGSGNTVSTSSLAVANSLLFLADGNPADILDFGTIGEYKYGATTKYAGFVRDATDGVFKLFANNSVEPANTVNFSGEGNLFGTLAVGTANVANTTASSSSTTGALTVAGGAGIAGDLYTGGIIDISSTAASTSTTTGALIVDGGAGIAGNTNIGGITSIANTTKLQQIIEKVTVSATAAATTVNYDALTQAVLYYTSNASGNWTLNIRGSSSVPLNNIMATGDSMTFAFLVTNGSTPYYQTGFTIDGNAVTPKYQNGSSLSAGNANSIDIYSITVIKTGSATFTALVSQTKFA